MKIRITFVSNSSSTSFVLLGVSPNKDILSKIDPYGDICCTYGYYCLSKDIKAFGCYNDIDYIGMDIAKFLMADMRLSEIKPIVIENLSKLGVNINKENLRFVFEEFGGG